MESEKDVPDPIIPFNLMRHLRPVREDGYRITRRGWDAYLLPSECDPDE